MGLDQEIGRPRLEFLAIIKEVTNFQQVWNLSLKSIYINSDKMSGRYRRESVSNLSALPVKAFWQPSQYSKFLVFPCKSCQPYILMDRVFGEWTCRICGRQEYGENPMKKHVAKNHKLPTHTCGKADISNQDEVLEDGVNGSDSNNEPTNNNVKFLNLGDGNNNESDNSALEGSEFEPMEAESVGSVDPNAETDWEEAEEVEGMDKIQTKDSDTSLKDKGNRHEEELQSEEHSEVVLKSPTSRLGEKIVELKDSFKLQDSVLGEFSCNICKYTSYKKWQILQHVHKRHNVQVTPRVDKARKTIKKYPILAGTEKRKN